MTIRSTGVPAVLESDLGQRGIAWPDTVVEVAPNSRPLSLMITGNKHDPNLGLNESPQNHDKLITWWVSWVVSQPRFTRTPKRSKPPLSLVMPAGRQAWQYIEYYENHSRENHRENVGVSLSGLITHNVTFMSPWSWHRRGHNTSTFEYLLATAVIDISRGDINWVHVQTPNLGNQILSF